MDEFFKQTAIDLAHPPSKLPAGAKELLSELVRSSKQVVDDVQLVINQRGIGYKNFIPATFGSQAAHRFSIRSRAKMKQTALNPRNLKNRPDEYEARVLQRFAIQPAMQNPVVEWTDDGKIMRAISPIYYSQDCLTCHGAPKGILDISGYPREGATEGDLAGAISIQISLNGPLDACNGSAQTNKAKLVAHFAAEFQALNSLPVAEALERRLQAEGCTLDVLMQVNTPGESSRYGLLPDETGRRAALYHVQVGSLYNQKR